MSFSTVAALLGLSNSIKFYARVTALTAFFSPALLHEFHWCVI